MDRSDQMELHIREEEELNRLKRQFRIMTNDRNAVLAAYGLKSGRRKRFVEALQRQEVELRLEVEAANNEGMKEEREVGRVILLVRQMEKMLEETTMKKKQIAELERQIREVQKNIRDAELKSVSVKEIEEAPGAEKALLLKLEDRLETAVKQFCSVLADNKQLREEIESLLKDRRIFNANWEKLVLRLNDGKRVMLDLIEQSTLAYDQREEWMEKLNALKHKAYHMVTTHTDEMRDLKRKLDLQTDLGHFLEKKCQKRILVDLERKEKLHRDEAKAQEEQQLQHYADTFKKIKDFVGEDDVKKIQAQFVKREEENFALFTYVNELNNELEILAENTKKLFVKIGEQKDLNDDRASNQQQNLEALRLELRKHAIEADKEEIKLNSKKLQLMQTIGAISDLFGVLNSDAAPILELLGEDTHINEHNVLLHMTVLETQLGEILKDYNYRRFGNKF